APGETAMRNSAGCFALLALGGLALPCALAQAPHYNLEGVQATRDRKLADAAPSGLIAKGFVSHPHPVHVGPTPGFRPGFAPRLPPPALPGFRPAGPPTFRPSFSPGFRPGVPGMISSPGFRGNFSHGGRPTFTLNRPLYAYHQGWHHGYGPSWNR